MRKLGLIPVMALALAVPAAAKAPMVPSMGCTQPYYVKEGDNLWTLADVRWQNPELWRWLVQQNPILQEPGRFASRDGKDIVLIRPGEALYCLSEAGINIGALDMASAADAMADTASIQDESFREKFAEWLGENWWWLALLALGLFFFWWLLRELRKDPVESRPAQVAGGISSVEQATARFADRAFRQHFTILDTVGGNISGTLMVRYGDGTERPRKLDRQRAYRATVRFEDGTVENLYMLQACGNDLRYGGIARYVPGANFWFVADTVSAPKTETPAEEVADATVTEIASAEQTDKTVDDSDMIRIELQGANNDANKKAMVRITGAPVEGMVVEMTTRSFTMRWIPDQAN